MKSKKDVQALIKTIKAKTGKTQEEISQEAGYKPKTLSQLLSKGEGMDAVYTQLNIAFRHELNNSTSAPKTHALPKMLMSPGDIDVNASLAAITKALWNLENGQAYIRAEIRGYGQYQILKELKWDQAKFLSAMDEVGKLIGANLKADDLRGS